MKNVFLSLLFLASAALPSYAQFAKHDWSNQLLGETYLSDGNSFYRQNQIEVDAFGNIIGAGTNGFSEMNQYSFKKSNSDGELIWVKEMGTGNTDISSQLIDLETDAAGNVYLLGLFKGMLDVGTSDDEVLIGDPFTDARFFFIAKYSPDGDLLWSFCYDAKRLIPRELELSPVDGSVTILGYYFLMMDDYILDPDIEFGVLEQRFGKGLFLLSLSSAGNVNWVHGLGVPQSMMSPSDLLIDSDGQIILSCFATDVFTIGGVEVGEEDKNSLLVLRFEAPNTIEVLQEVSTSGSSFNHVHGILLSNFTEPNYSYARLHKHGNDLWLSGVFSDEISVNDNYLEQINDSNYSNFLLKLHEDPDSIVLLEVPRNEFTPSLEFSSNNDDMLVLTGYFQEPTDFDWTSGERILSPSGNGSAYMLGVSNDGDFMFADVLAAESNSVFYDIEYVREDKFILTGSFLNEMDASLNLDTTIIYDCEQTNGFELQVDIRVIRAICKDTVEVMVDHNGELDLDIQMVDDGSYTEYENPLEMTLSADMLDCQSIAEGEYVELSVTDNILGYTDVCSSYIIPIDMVPPVALCQSAALHVDGDGIAELSVEDVDADSYDNCTIDTLVLSQYVFDCTSQSSQSVSLTVTDASGLSNTCEASIILVDDIIPAVDCEDQTVYLDENGEVDQSILFDQGTVSDNCSIASLELLLHEDICLTSLTELQAELVAIDAYGNANSCELNVMVLDTLSPALECRDLRYTLSVDQEQLFLEAEDFVQQLSDNCAIADVSVFPEELGIDDLGVNSLMVEATDLQGNKTTCIAQLDLFALLNAEDLLYMPNVFSPNNDGINDQLSPFCSKKVERIEQFTILDRWGNIHYEEKDFEPVNSGLGWTGTFAGQPSPMGVYFYQLRVLAVDGLHYEFIGTVNLL